MHGVARLGSGDEVDCELCQWKVVKNGMTNEKQEEDSRYNTSEGGAPCDLDGA
jgi:hypothetical protein